MPSANMHVRRAFLVLLILTLILASKTTQMHRLMLNQNLLGFRFMASSVEHAAPTGSSGIDGSSIIARHRQQDFYEAASRPVDNATGSSKFASGRPIFILHVGPPKTGSTTLQCTLESLRRELDEDGLAYIGRPECASMGIDVDPRNKREFHKLESVLVTGYDCQRKMNEWEQQNKQEINVNVSSAAAIMPTSTVQPAWPSCWQEFLQHLEAHLREGKNHVMFSDEAMANRLTRSSKYKPSLPYPWRTLRTSLEQRGWDVRILLVHRPLYDYLPSVYVEQYKYGPNKVKLQRWFGGDDSSGDGGVGASSSTGSTCPQQGGRKVPRPFDTDTKEITIARLIEEGQALYPKPAQVFKLCQKHGFKTMLVDMMESFDSPNRRNNKVDFIQHIVCNVLPGTSRTCRALLDGADEVKIEDGQTEGKAPHLNPSLPLAYDFIAVEACQRGLLNGIKVERDVARRAIQRHQEYDLGLSAIDFPLICPDNETMAKILQLSIAQERELRMGRYTQDDFDRHEEEYWNGPISKRKYCTVDARKVVKDEGWANFFLSLDTE